MAGDLLTNQVCYTFLLTLLYFHVEIDFETL